MTDQPNTSQQFGLSDGELIRLTEDEVALVLAAAHLPRIMGYEVPEDLQPATLEAARHTLMARGGARLQTDGTVVIDENIANIVGKGARWARLITLVLKFDNGFIERHWVYMGPGASVWHSIPEPGIHQFQTIPDGKSMLLMLAGMLRIRLRNDATPGNAEFNVDPKMIDDAEAVRMSEGAEAAYNMLVKAGLPASFSESLVVPSINAVVAVTWPTTGIPNSDGRMEFTERMAWVRGAPGESGYWMLFPDRANRTIRVAPVNGRQVINVISDYVVEDLKSTR